MSQFPTGTVTFLFSDIESSTRLWEEHPEEMTTALAEHDRIMRSVLTAAGGYIFATGGDAYSVAFQQAVDAADAAIKAQSELKQLAVGGSPVHVRMAINTGTADERDGDYFGPVLNRTARLLSAGNGGQVLISLPTKELIQDTLPDGSALEDLGKHRLKDLSRPEKVFKLGHPSIRNDPRPLRSLDAYAHNLPIQLTSFVGREQELAEVKKLLSGSRMVTLAGVGGAGKTRLAVQTAAELLSRYEDGVWLIELAPVTEGGQLLTNVMDVLGIDERPGEDPRETTAKWLSSKQLLLVLDNCEHLVEPAARFAANALGAGQGVSILATSREMLGVPGEYPYQVRSLASPDSMDEVVRSVVIRYPAVRLFAERAEVARPGWRLSGANAQSVVQICRRLDGMPLAIELAAARLRMMKTEQISERLDDRFRLLTGGSRTVLPRQQTLEAAIDWSFDLLSDDEKVLFRRLAVFIGGFTLEAAESVCGTEPLDEYAVLDDLGHLVDKSLVQADETEDGIRYRFLETLRQYARLKLASSSEVDDLRHRHARHYLELALQADAMIRSAEEAYWFRRIDTELDNLRQAMWWALENNEAEIAQDLAGSLYRYFMYRVRSMEGLEWAERAVTASDDPTPARAKALLAAGTLAQIGLNLDASMKHLDQALELARHLDLEDVLSASVNNRANVAESMGMFEEAARLHEESLEIARQQGSAPGIVISLINLSNRALDAEDFELALSRAREAVAVSTQLGSPLMLEEASATLFSVYRLLGDHEKAASLLELMIGEEEEGGSPRAPGRTNVMAAVLAMDRGKIKEAVEPFKTALRRFRSTEEPDSVMWVVQLFLWQGARLMHGLQHPVVACTLLGASDATVKVRGFIRSPNESRELERVRAELRDSLPPAEFESAYEEGAALDPRRALDLLEDVLAEATT